MYPLISSCVQSGSVGSFKIVVNVLEIDSMESLPHDLTEMIFYLGNQYIQPGSTLLDLSCGPGDVLAPFASTQWHDVNILACNPTGDFMIDDTCYYEDITKHYPYYGVDPEKCYTSLTLAIGTMQEYDIATRHKVLLDIYNTTLPGGALILVERVLADSFDLTEPFRNVALSMYDHCDEVKKAITPTLHNEYMFEAGFIQVECFYKVLDLAAYIAVKTE